jgi:hypothetical protein
MILDNGLVLGSMIEVRALLGEVLGVADSNVGNVWFCAPSIGKVFVFVGTNWTGMGLWFVLGVVLGFELRL